MPKNDGCSASSPAVLRAVMERMAEYGRFEGVCQELEGTCKGQIVDCSALERTMATANYAAGFSVALLLTVVQ